MDFAVVEKLRFILNRDVEMVMAPKEDILTAINRYYGQTETESVDSMLMEFTETAIDFTETELAEASTQAEDKEK
ncbi:MAG: type II/IV secretion system protein, partial [Planctomycetaceae bacterium]|nr:type II/IV secretion system protein [Planctomycetaceae bacterium]